MSDTRTWTITRVQLIDALYNRNSSSCSTTEGEADEILSQLADDSIPVVHKVGDAVSDELRRMNITAWSPSMRAIVRAALLRAAADASHEQSVEAVRIVRMIDEVNEEERS